MKESIDMDKEIKALVEEIENDIDEVDAASKRLMKHLAELMASGEIAETAGLTMKFYNRILANYMKLGKVTEGMLSQSRDDIAAAVDKTKKEFSRRVTE
jgi:hypothetical protein